MPRKTSMTITATLLLLSVAGCGASGPFFQPAAINENVAAIYIYRPGMNYVGSGMILIVRCDGEKVGTLKPNGYLATIVSPGHHVISCATETKTQVPFDAEAGESYYIEMGIDMGLFMGRPRLIMVPPETGQRAILGTRYSGRTPPPHEVAIEELHTVQPTP